MDEQKKKMLMIGGVVALAVVIIIAAAVMMDHKKKIEQSAMIVHTTTGAIIAPANGATRPLLNYIQFSDIRYGPMYLVFKDGKELSATANLSEATPVTFTNCSDEYCIMYDNKNVKINPQYLTVNIGGTDSNFTSIYIHSLAETTYIGLVGTTDYYHLGSDANGFYRRDKPSPGIWKVVSI